jgi:hypothetical protein
LEVVEGTVLAELIRARTDLLAVVVGVLVADDALVIGYGGVRDVDGQTGGVDSAVDALVEGRVVLGATGDGTQETGAVGEEGEGAVADRTAAVSGVDCTVWDDGRHRQADVLKDKADTGRVALLAEVLSGDRELLAGYEVGQVVGETSGEIGDQEIPGLASQTGGRVLVAVAVGNIPQNTGTAAEVVAVLAGDADEDAVGDGGGIAVKNVGEALGEVNIEDVSDIAGLAHVSVDEDGLAVGDVEAGGARVAEVVLEVVDGIAEDASRLTGRVVLDAVGDASHREASCARLPPEEVGAKSAGIRIDVGGAV